MWVIIDCYKNVTAWNSFVLILLKEQQRPLITEKSRSVSCHLNKDFNRLIENKTNQGW